MGGATAARGAGSKLSNRMPAAPRNGLPDACPKPGSTAIPRSSSTAKRSRSSASWPKPDSKEESEARVEGRVSRFREDTRSERMNIADEAQDRYGRKVSWGVEVGSKTGTERILFTHIAVPVMTRLKQPERQVLDTLVDAGVARSRADALAWSVKLVGEHTEEWLAKLRSAMSEVDDLRAQGPDLQS